MMMSIATWFVQSKVGRAIGLTLTLIAALLVFAAKVRKNERAEQSLNTLEQDRKGRDAAQDEVEATRDLSVDDLIDRMRRRSRYW